MTKYILIAFVIFQIDVPWTEGGTPTPHLPTMNVVAEFDDFTACIGAKELMEIPLERTHDPRLHSWKNAIFVSINCYPKGVRFQP